MSGSVAFPIATTDIEPTRTSTVLGDNGSQGGDFTVEKILRLISLDDIRTQLMTFNEVVEPVASGTTAYAVVATDKNKTKRFLSTGACTVSLPAGMPIGFSVSWIQAGAGTLTFASAASAGQTINSAAGLRSGGQHGRGSLTVVDSNTWNLSGFTQA